MDSIIYKNFNSVELPVNFVNIPFVSNAPSLEYRLDERLCDSIIATMNTFAKNKEYDVGVNGLFENDYGVGSVRVTNYDVDFAKFLTEELSPHIPSILRLNEHSPVDWQSQNPKGYNVWAFEGVSPVFRYMRYEANGEHFPHYDAPYISPEDPYIRTLMSGVLYLTTNKSGATGFIEDNQNDKPFTERDTSDWTRQANVSEVLNWSLPEKGKIIIFPHQVCHNVFPLLENEERIIIRFDLFFNALSKE